MLKVFRENLKYLSWVLWVIVILFVASLFFDFGRLDLGASSHTNAAKVGNQTVTRAEFVRQYRQLTEQFRQMYGDQLTPEVAEQLQLPLQALNQAVSRKILIDEAERMGLRATDSELRDEILEIPGFKDEAGNFIGQKQYTQILRQNEQTVASFEQSIRESILIRKLQQSMLASAYVSSDDVEKSYRQQVEKAKIRYLQLPRNRFLQGAEIPQAELQAYFNTHKEQYRLPEQREAAYVVVDAGKLLNEIKVEDPEIRSYYDSHQQEFTQKEQVHARHILLQVNDKRTDEAARTQLEAAKKRIEGGADFAKVASEISDDPGSKAKGGDLGFFGRETMVKEFADAAFGAQPNQLVGPVKSSFGYHLIQVLEKRPGGVRPFEEARLQIRGILASQRVQDIAQARAQELAKKAADQKIKTPEALEALAKDVAYLSAGRTGRFGKEDPIVGLGRSGLNDALFALKKGELSQAVQVPRGWAVAYLYEVHEPRVPELKDVEPRVRLSVAVGKQQQMVMEKLSAARADLAKGKTLEQVAAELGVPVQQSEEFGGQGNIPGLGFNPELAKAALALPSGQIGGPVADSQGGVIFQVTEHKEWDPKQFAEAREQTRTSLQQQRLGRLLGSLLEVRRRELGVEFNRQLLEEFHITEAATQKS
jgi:peptidyl-prolyl cis-trans isomerase D